MISILAVGGHCLVYQQGQIRNQAPRTVQNTQMFYSIPFVSSHGTINVVEKKFKVKRSKHEALQFNQVHVFFKYRSILAFVSAARNNDIWV